ncbi:MAG: universal stress protein [Fimbriiglobus sp.]
MIHVKKILYPTDFSSYSNAAYFHALALAVTYGAELTIVYVYTPGQETHGSPAAEKQHWRSQLEQIRPAHAKTPVHHVFLEGDAAMEIVRYAEDSGVDVIVLGTHGRTGVDRLVMGSVAEKVVRDSACSVLVVKLPKSTARPTATVTA